MTNIYDQHRAAFARVSAFVILKDGERVATVAIKFPADGAGRLYAYFHVLGVPMARAFAGGYGYDKRSAAVSAALAKVAVSPPLPDSEIGEASRANYRAMCEREAAKAAAWRALAPTLNKGDDWTRALEKAGFTVLQAV